MNTKFVTVVILLLIGAATMIWLGVSANAIESHNVSEVLAGTFPAKGLSAERARAIDFTMTGHCVEFDPAKPRTLLMGGENPKRAPGQQSKRLLRT